MQRGLPRALLPKPLTLNCLPQSYGKELAEAYEWLQKYMQSRKEAELHQAWDLYYHVFKRINKQLPTLTQLELQYVSPALAKAEVRQRVRLPSRFLSADLSLAKMCLLFVVQVFSRLRSWWTCTLSVQYRRHDRDRGAQ